MARFINSILLRSQQTALRAFVFFCFRSAENRVGQRQGNILVVKTGGLGDFLFAVPAIKVLKKDFPAANIILLTQIAFSGQHLKNLRGKGLQDLPWLNLTKTYFDEMIVFEGISVSQILKLRKSLKTKDISSIIYMSAPGEPFLSIIKKLLFFIAVNGSRPAVFGWKQDFSTAYFRKKHGSWGLSQHKINGPLRAVTHFLGYEVQVSDNDLKLPSPPNKLDNSRLISFKDSLEYHSGYIVICPGSSAPWKNWGQIKYRELCEQLSPILKKKNIVLVIAGPKSDRPLAGFVADGLQARNICGEYSITELSEIFRHSLCVVTTDGGLAHLAAFSDAWLVSLSNGGEEAGVVTPVGNKVVELRNHISCAPCFGMDHCPLQHSKCVKDIEVKVVAKAVSTIIE